MPISTPAQIRLPLDIPKVDVIATKQTQDGKFIITVESRIETTKCGVCKKTIPCTYGHGQAVRLRHLPILGQETYIVIRPRRTQQQPQRDENNEEDDRRRQNEPKAKPARCSAVVLLIWSRLSHESGVCSRAGRLLKLFVPDMLFHSCGGTSRPRASVCVVVCMTEKDFRIS